jgi:hypothetical protein
MTSRPLAVVAWCLGLLAVPAVAAADEIEWMYDPDQVVEIRLGGLSAEELDELEDKPDEYVRGSFELLVNGALKGPLLNDVGIRLKGGFGSSRPVKTGKSGFKVRFDEFVKGQLFFGIKLLTLNSMIQDPSMVHETLTYELFHSLGLPASRTGYAFVDLNGNDYGLFLNLETLDEISLPQWFKTTGHLYEADVPETDVTTGSAVKFEVDEGDEEDLADLEALITAVNYGAGDWSDDVSPSADLGQMTAQWAVERYVSHWDGYAGEADLFRPNNYYLHSDVAGIFQMMPWGTDQTWGFSMEFDKPAGGIMFNECLADESCKQLFLEGLTDVACVAPGLDLSERAGQLAAMLAPYQAKEDPDRREATAKEISAAVKEVEFLAAVRPEELEDYLTAEGVLGRGPDPCALPPEPEKPTEPVVTPVTHMGPPAPERGVRFGPTQLRGSSVSTRLDVPGAGAVTQVVSARIDGRRVRACSIWANAPGAGEVKVGCRLREQVRAARAEGLLKLRVRIAFSPEGSGQSGFVRRTLDAPKRG